MAASVQLFTTYHISHGRQKLFIFMQRGGLFDTHALRSAALGFYSALPHFKTDGVLTAPDCFDRFSFEEQLVSLKVSCHVLSIVQKQTEERQTKDSVRGGNFLKRCCFLFLLHVRCSFPPRDSCKTVGLQEYL